MLDCLVGALSTGVVAFLARRRLFAQNNELGNDELLTLLQSRGFDVENHAMEAYLEKTYSKLDMLGEGQSGVVWKVRQNKTGEHFAMKCIKKKKGQAAKNCLETEMKCLRKLQHRHIVNIVDSVESRDTLWIVMECAEGGGLYERIVQLRHFSERTAARTVKQVLKAVHYMHLYGVVHRDLKPENILLMSADQDSDIKVADFGLAVVLENGLQANRIDDSMRMKAATDITEGFVGSPICMAPEVATHRAAYGPQCDIWSVGCIAYELLSGNPPFIASSAPELFQLIHTVQGPSFHDIIWLRISADAKDLVVDMLRRHPQDRVSAREALQHSWFRTAPDNHNALAQESIIRRFTTRTSFATTATMFGAESRAGSRRPSRAPSLSLVTPRGTMPRPSLSTTSARGGIMSLLEDVVSREDDLRSNLGDDARSEASRLPSNYQVDGVLHCVNNDRLRTEASLESVSSRFAEDGEIESAKDDMEGKVFQIAHGGLQQAAWGIHVTRATDAH